MSGRMKGLPINVRLLSRTVIDDGFGCWEFTGTTSGGYGMIGRPNNGGMALAHRISYELFVGEIPEGLTIDHLCRNRRCINPWHLEAVTGKVNVLRGDGPTAKNVRKTHCPKGHPYSAENTRIGKNGGRFCRTCHREANAAWRAKNPNYFRDWYQRNKDTARCYELDRGIAKRAK